MLGCVKNNASRENWSMCFSLPVNVCLVLEEAERHESRREMTEMFIHPRDLKPIHCQFFLRVYSENVLSHQCVWIGRFPCELLLYQI